MDIPIELFITWLVISLAFVGIGFAFRPRIPLFIMIGGILIFPFMAITDNVIMGYNPSSVTPNIYTYNQEDVSGLADVCDSGGACNDIRGQYVTSTSSMLYGDTIDCIDMQMRKLGAPTGTAIIGVWDHAQAVNDPMIKQFGQIDVTLLSTSVAEWYSFCLPSGQLYTIGDQDVLGARFDAGDVSNSLRVNIATVDQFDSTNSQLSQKADATNVWGNTGTSDLTARFYLRALTEVNEPILFKFDEYPKIFFGLYGSMLIFIGALIYQKEK